MCITLNQKAEFDLETLDFIKKNPNSFNYDELSIQVRHFF